MAKQRILIVDDEAEICEIICAYLAKKGFFTESAYNGEEALQKIEKNKPDLIILDVLMPKMDGFELLKYLKSDNDYIRIPVIMLTVKSGPRHLEQGISFGADFYLPKPFRFDNLMQFIDLILGSKR